MTRILCCFLFFLTLTAGTAWFSPANAQALTTLHDFSDGSAVDDGDDPVGLTLGSDGNFYAVTNAGGNAGTLEEGTIIKMTPAGVVTVLHDFTDDGTTSGGSNLDGADPLAGLVEGADGDFYGTTEVGGSTGNGVAYKITPTGTFTTLHNFSDGTVASDGSEPASALILGTDGNFYGTTAAGGASAVSGTLYSGSGTVFKMTPAGVVTVLHSFTALSSSFTNSDGATPYSGLVQGGDGNFYGTTLTGGAAAEGTVYKITPTGTLTTLVTFNGTNGGFPYAGLVQGSDGNFYGTTEDGGTSSTGTVFKVTSTGTLTTLYGFSTVTSTVPYENNDGAYPETTLVQGMNGSFYGTTGGGGANGSGTLFEVAPSGTLNTLYTFSAIDGNDLDSDGDDPATGLIAGPNGFYGTTVLGGTEGGGTIFRFNVSNTPLAITSLSPPSATAGNPTFSLTINGRNFTNSTAVTFGGIAVTITSHATTRLTVTVPASAVTMTGAKTVAASDPANGSASAIFTVTPPWNVQDVAAVSDGTARLLWDRGDGVAGIWVLSAANTQTLAGPTYGPYQGWTAQDIAAASDGTSRILWNRYDGATGVWAMNAAGVETSVGPTYGPFSGWKAIDLATAPNGASRLMWRYTNGEAGLLSLSATGSQVISGRSYGPYTGWTATAVGAAGDGTARMLWTRSDGAMGLWSMDAQDLQLSVGPTYGPYSDSHGRWTATDMSTSSDGTSEVLWKRSDGAIGVWTFSAGNTMTTVGSVYGPYPGFTAAALDASGDKARVLWVRSDRAAGLWSFGSNDIENLIGPVYGPY